MIFIARSGRPKNWPRAQFRDLSSGQGILIFFSSCPGDLFWIFYGKKWFLLFGCYFISSRAKEQRADIFSSGVLYPFSRLFSSSPFTFKLHLPLHDVIDGCDCCVWFTYHRNYLFLLYLSNNDDQAETGRVGRTAVFLVVVVVVVAVPPWPAVGRPVRRRFERKKNDVTSWLEEPVSYLIRKDPPSRQHHLSFYLLFYLAAADLKRSRKHLTIRLAVPNLPLRGVHENHAPATNNQQLKLYRRHLSKKGKKKQNKILIWIFSRSWSRFHTVSIDPSTIFQAFLSALQYRHCGMSRHKSQNTNLDRDWLSTTSHSKCVIGRFCLLFIIIIFFIPVFYLTFLPVSFHGWQRKWRHLVFLERLSSSQFEKSIVCVSFYFKKSNTRSWFSTFFSNFIFIFLLVPRVWKSWLVVLSTVRWRWRSWPKKELIIKISEKNNNKKLHTRWFWYFVIY